MNDGRVLSKQAMLTSGPVREKYKWILLVLLFVAFFLELGSRQLYNAALPQIRLEFIRLGVTDAQLGAVGSVFAAVIGWMNDHMSMRSGFASLVWFYLVGALVLLPALVWLFKKDYIADVESQGGR